MVEVRIFVDADRVDAVSIRRADYWLVEARRLLRAGRNQFVSIRRADYWLVEVSVRVYTPVVATCFNPPGGLLVG